MRGSRLKFWKTKPILRLRTRARSSAADRSTSSPSSQYSPDGRPVEAAEDVHQRGLARAGGAHQRDHLAALDRQRDALEHRHVDLAEVVGLVDVFEADEFHGGQGFRRAGIRLREPEVRDRRSKTARASDY